MSQQTELVDKNMKTFIFSVFHILKNLEERLSMLSRGVEHVKKTSK